MDSTDIAEFFAPLGDVTVKRLFSGQGIYHQGLIVGAVMDGDILLKADATSEQQFQAAGATQWTYQYPDGRTIKMPYWSVPPDALDDPDQRAPWLALAYAAALRAGSKSKSRKIKR